MRWSDRDLVNADPMATAALPKINPLRQSLSPIDPLRYPGRRSPRDVLLMGQRELPLRASPAAPLGESEVSDEHGELLGELDELLGAQGVAPTPERTAVAVVGVNGDPVVLARKLERGRVSTTVPYLLGRVENARVGHSAHVSRGGYIPLTVIHEPGAGADAAVLLLDGEQLAVVDGTEPNYVRVELSARQYPMTLAATGDRLGDCQVYVSKWGVLTDGDAVLDPVSQHRLFARLARFDPEFGRLIIGLTPQQITRMLAVEDLQEYLRGHWKRSGFCRACGLIEPAAPGH